MMVSVSRGRHEGQIVCESGVWVAEISVVNMLVLLALIVIGTVRSVWEIRTV